MLKVGRINNLEVLREVDFGYYLDGDEYEDILFPKKYASDDIKIGDVISVMVYLDSEERLIATTEQPLAQVGEFAMLEVTDVTDFGAFLNWGLTKQLFVPFAEQAQKMERGKKYLVYVYIDPLTERITASSKLSRFLHQTLPNYEENQKIRGIIWTKTDIAYKVIINESHTGLLYSNEVFKPINIGQKLELYIKKVRDDFKIDLSMHGNEVIRFDEFSSAILQKLMANQNGFIAITDKTPPDVIYNTFGMSKKNYKKAVGKLYKEKKIMISDEGLQLIENNPDKQ